MPPLKAVWSGGKGAGPNDRQPQRTLRVSQGNPGRPSEVAGSRSPVTRMGWARLVSWAPAYGLSASLRESRKVGVISTHRAVLLLFIAPLAFQEAESWELVALELPTLRDRGAGREVGWLVASLHAKSFFAGPTVGQKLELKCLPRKWVFSGSVKSVAS